MANKRRKRKLKKPRNLVVLVMILSRKGGKMKDRRAGRKGEAERKALSEDTQ